MVALPLIKLFALGARQVSRPVARGLVGYATEHRRLTFNTCIAFGRLSLGLSSVIAEWTRKEALRHEELLRSKADPEGKTSSSAAKEAHAVASVTSTRDAPTSESHASSIRDDTRVDRSGTASHDATHSTNVRRKVMLETDSIPVIDAETTRFMKDALAVATGQHSSTVASSANPAGVSALSGTSAAGSSAAAAGVAGATSSLLHNVHGARQMSSASVSSASSDVNTPTTTTPRSRSLIQSLMYGPQPLHEEAHRTPLTSHNGRGGRRSDEEDDEELFANAHTRTRGEVARLFIRYPYRSTWYVFRKTFYAPFPQQQLLDAGAELLVEILVFSILTLFLYLELRQTQNNNARKEAYLEARFLTIENKINELIDAGKLNRPVPVQALAPQEEFSPVGRIDWITYPAQQGIKLISWLVTGDSAQPSDATATSAAVVSGGEAHRPAATAHAPAVNYTSTECWADAATSHAQVDGSPAALAPPVRHSEIAKISHGQDDTSQSSGSSNGSRSGNTDIHPICTTRNAGDGHVMPRDERTQEAMSLLRRVMSFCHLD